MFGGAMRVLLESAVGQTSGLTKASLVQEAIHIWWGESGMNISPPSRLATGVFLERPLPAVNLELGELNFRPNRPNAFSIDAEYLNSPRCILFCPRVPLTNSNARTFIIYTLSHFTALRALQLPL